jgi:hypothetical protein
MRQAGYKLVESRPPKGVKEITCGRCVAGGALRRMTPMPEPDLVNPNMDLKAFRLSYEMKGTQLALYLGVHKAMVSQVENGKKEMPISWVEKLKKLTEPGVASKWTKS